MRFGACPSVSFLFDRFMQRVAVLAARGSTASCARTKVHRQSRVQRALLVALSSLFFIISDPYQLTRYVPRRAANSASGGMQAAQQLAHA
jgi:hypothetical protein